MTVWKIMFLVLATALVFSLPGCFGGSEEDMTENKELTDNPGALPPIDLKVLEVTETATFALG